MGDAWEVDIEKLTLNDLEVLEKGLAPGSSASQIKQTLGRLVTNKTAEEIGEVSFGELKQRIEELERVIAQMSIPKENATP